MPRTWLGRPAPRWLWAVLAAAIALHLYGLYRPGQPDEVQLFPHADKLWHFLGFALPATLAVLLVQRWWPIAAFAVNAVLSEIVQHLWLPLRDGSPADLAADLLGLLPAVALYVLQRGVSSAATSAARPTSRTSAASRRPKA